MQERHGYGEHSIFTYTPYLQTMTLHDTFDEPRIEPFHVNHVIYYLALLPLYDKSICIVQREKKGVYLGRKLPYMLL